jgi:putative tryptophan/tyrosine transport system substrate-binding protein
MGMLVNPTNPLISQAETRDLQTAARGLGLRVLVLNAGTESEVAAAFATLVEQRAGALLIGSDTFFVADRDQIILLAARHAVPTMFFESAHVSAGGLSSNGRHRSALRGDRSARSGRGSTGHCWRATRRKPSGFTKKS